MKKLTPSKIHYLKAIYALSSADAGARISDIAERLSVSKASVCAAVDFLQESRLAARGKDHQIYLTKPGLQQAVLLADRFTLISEFFTKVLRVTEKTAISDASTLEHLVSDKTLLAMNNYMKTLPEANSTTK